MRSLILLLSSVVIISGRTVVVSQDRSNARLRPKPPVPSVEEHDPASERARAEKLRRLRESVARHGHDLTTKVSSYVPPVSFQTIAKESDVVVVGMIVGISDAYEKFATAYQDVTVKIEEVVRSRASHPIPTAITFRKLGGTLTFPEGRVTWVEIDNEAFVLGERHILFLKQERGVWEIRYHRYGRAKIEGGQVMPYAAAHQQFKGMDVRQFIRFIQGL